MVGVINNFGGFCSTELYVHEARMAGGRIEAPCVNNSLYATTIGGRPSTWVSAYQITGTQDRHRHTGRTAAARSFLSLDDFLPGIHHPRATGRSSSSSTPFVLPESANRSCSLKPYMRMHKTRRTVPSLQLFATQPDQPYQFPTPCIVICWKTPGIRSSCWAFAGIALHPDRPGSAGRSGSGMRPPAALSERSGSGGSSILRDPEGDLHHQGRGHVLRHLH